MVNVKFRLAILVVYLNRMKSQPAKSSKIHPFTNIPKR
jgi:hypothetical protein